MPSVNITAFFTHGVAPMDLSASVAEIGSDAGASTWSASLETADELQLLTTDEEREAFARFLKDSGGDFLPLSERELQALFLQWIASDLRQFGARRSTDAIDWAEVRDGQESGVYPSNIWRADDGSIFFDLE